MKYTRTLLIAGSLMLSLWLSTGGFAAQYLAIYARSTATATPTPTSTPTPGTVEQAWYLTNIGQASGYLLPISGTYGQVNLAARIGWRWLQPSKTGAFTWTILDGMQKAAHNAGAKWSLSITAGAYTPLWLFNNGGSFPCTASAVTGEDPPQATGTLQAFQFIWTPTFIYTPGSTQCAPVPWDTAYQTAFQSFINSVSTHDGNGYGYGIKDDPNLDHIVLTGINSTTQENMLPFCTTHSSTCGVGGSNTDISEWESILTSPPVSGTCTGNSLALCPAFDNSTSGDYTTLIQTAWQTLQGYWTTAFPTKKVVTMFVDSQSFPFQQTSGGSSYPSVSSQKIIQHMIANNPSNSLVMNNSISGTSPYLPNKLTCYTTGVTGCLPPPTGFTQPSHAIAGQEGAQITSGLPSCTNSAAFASMMSAAFTDQSQFMEIYDADVKCLP